MNRFFTCLLVAGLLYACKTNQIQNTSESFSEFRQEFYRDSTFQVNRIQFPLSGVNTEDMDLESGQSEYYWHKDTWKVLHIPDSTSTKGLKHEIKVKDSTAREKFYLPDSGFLVELTFIQENGKWFLTEFVNSQL